MEMKAEEGAVNVTAATEPKIVVTVSLTSPLMRDPVLLESTGGEHLTLHCSSHLLDVFSGTIFTSPMYLIFKHKFKKPVIKSSVNLYFMNIIKTND